MSADTSPTPQPQSPTPTPFDMSGASTPRTLSATPVPDNYINLSATSRPFSGNTNLSATPRQFSGSGTPRSLASSTPNLAASTPNLNLSEQTPTYREHGDIGPSPLYPDEEYGTSPVYGSDEEGFSPEYISARSSQQSTPMPAGMSMSPTHLMSLSSGNSPVCVPENSLDSEDTTLPSAGVTFSTVTTSESTRPGDVTPKSRNPRSPNFRPRMLSVVHDLKQKALEQYRKNTPWSPSKLDPNFRKNRKEIIIVFKMRRSTSFADLRSLKSNLSSSESQRFQPELPALTSNVSLSSYGRN